MICMERNIGSYISEKIIKPIVEIIGRWTSPQTQLNKLRISLNVTDLSRPDYAFWDQLRRGKKKGYFLSSLFLRRIEKIFSAWVFTLGFEIKTASKHKHTDKVLNEFINDIATSEEVNDSLLANVFEQSLGLGDQFIVINSDGSISIPSPDTVIVELNPIDYREVLSIELVNITSGYSTSDKYYPDRRVITVKKGLIVQSITTFDNLIGRIPIVHITHDKGINERYGHPIHEILLPLLDLFDDTQFKQVNGANLLGNPILTFTGISKPNQVKDANKPASIEQYYDKDGNLQTREQFKLDNDSVIFTGKGGDAKFISPPVGFTRDTKTTLDSLFLLLIYHVGIPAFIWGAEMATARASSETQMQQWIMDVKRMQTSVSVWLVKLCKIWLSFKALTDKRIDTDSELIVIWKPISVLDKNVLLKMVQLAVDKGMLDLVTGLKLLQLGIDNPEEVVEKAQEDLKTKAAADIAMKQQDMGKKPGSSDNVGTIPDGK